MGTLVLIGKQRPCFGGPKTLKNRGLLGVPGSQTFVRFTTKLLDSFCWGRLRVEKTHISGVELRF